MKRIVAVVLILLGVLLAYYGYQDIEGSSSSINFLGLEIRAEDEASQEQGYILLAGAVLSVFLGVYLLSRSRRIAT